MEQILEAQRPTQRLGQRTASPALVDESAGTTFAAYLAHELRTPLATQRALLELGLADSTTDVAGWREIGADVLQACCQQARLLEACLTLAQSQGRLQRRVPLDLAVITADALRTHNPGKLECAVELEEAWTSGDPALVERLIANVVSNAIRHNHTGGRIAIATGIDSGRAVFSVINTGTVIPPDQLQRLFRPFERLSEDPRSFGDGVGLGLAIVRAIACAHNARLTARPQTCGGLTIDVAFPHTTEGAL